MKRTNTFLVLIAFLLGSQFSFAQDACYLEEVYSQVEVTENVVYGVNATVIQLPVVGEAVPQPLTMDIYEPVDGDEVASPLQAPQERTHKPKMTKRERRLAKKQAENPSGNIEEEDEEDSTQPVLRSKVFPSQS